MEASCPVVTVLPAATPRVSATHARRLASLIFVRANPVGVGVGVGFGAGAAALNRTMLLKTSLVAQRKAFLPEASV